MMKDAASFQPIDFMRFKPLYFAISLLVLIPGIVSLFTYGLKPSIDFTGGSLIEIRVPQELKITNDLIRQNLPSEVEIASIQPTSNETVIIRTSPITKDQNEAFKVSIATASGLIDPIASPGSELAIVDMIEEIRFETVGPTLGSELLRKTLFAVVLASIAIMLYVWSRFNEIKYGVSAILAMLHDSLVVLSVFSILGYFYGIEVDTLFVTALLTTLSFSVHDSIVVFDRIRESLKRYPKAPLTGLVNKAVTETLGRSINNSMTIIFMLLALWLMGGETTKWFVFALLIGAITGTYSSTFTAAPLLIVLDNFLAKKNKTKK
jgi:preprotein translocase subunit SecF